MKKRRKETIMKKIIALLLAALLCVSLFSLAACSEDTGTNSNSTNTQTNTDTQTDTNTQTETDPEPVSEETLRNSKACEYIEEKIAAGMQVTLGYSTLQAGSGMNEDLENGMKAWCAEHGWNYQMVDSQNNTATQVDQLENFAAMGNVACVAMTVVDVEAMRDILEAVEEAGTWCVTYGALPSYEIAGSTLVENYDLGYELGRMASGWVDVRYPDAGPGDIHACVTGFTLITDTTNIFNGAVDALEADPRIVVVYTDEGCTTLDQGFTTAEAAMTTDSSIRLFLTTISEQPGIGISNYIVAQGYDTDEFCVLHNSHSVIQDQLFAETEAGNGCIRGYTAGGGGTDGGIPIVLEELFYGSGYGYHLTLPIVAENIFGYEA